MDERERERRTGSKIGRWRGKEREIDMERAMEGVRREGRGRGKD